MSERIDAIFENGVFRPEVPVNIPNGERVTLDVERTHRANREATEAPLPVARIHSPRLSHPEQTTEFIMEVGEVPNAGV